MSKIVNFLSGMKVLEEVDSPINGKIQVIKSLAFGTYIQVDGLTQSGGVIKDVWRSTLKKVRNTKFNIQNTLILGLGGGSAAGLVKKNWPSAKITGVELDPIMVGLGKRHLALGNSCNEIVIGDALEFCKKANKKKEKWDLILNDIYIGHEVPKKFESDEYLLLVRRILARGGKTIFNRLYFDEKRAQAVKFGENLQKHFEKVDVVYPEANVMYVCSS